MTIWTLADFQGKKVGIDLLQRRLTDDEYSHVASWAMLRMNQLRNLGIDATTIHEPATPEAEYRGWDGYDVIMLYTDMAMANFVKSNIVNVYDVGFDKSAWYFLRLLWERHKDIRFVSLDWPMLDLGRRGKYKSTRPVCSDTWRNADWDLYQRKCDSIAENEWVLDPGFNYAKGQVRHLTMGDSHAHSAYKAGSMVLRKDGRTMAGIIKKGLEKELTDYGFDPTDIDTITAYYGSIDIRHHLCREPDPIAATKKLLADYEVALKALNRPIELVRPLPIEDESRVVPKMGWYKGQPFYGTQAQRKEVLACFTDCLHDIAVRNSWTVFEWPKSWYEMDGVAFMQTFMERPRSVHLGWKNYRWDLRNNVPNPVHDKVMPSANLLEF